MLLCPHHHRVAPPSPQPASIKVPVQAHFGSLDTMKGFSDPEVLIYLGGGGQTDRQREGEGDVLQLSQSAGAGGDSVLNIKH